MYQYITYSWLSFVNQYHFMLKSLGYIEIQYWKLASCYLILFLSG